MKLRLSINRLIASVVLFCSILLPVAGSAAESPAAAPARVDDEKSLESPSAPVVVDGSILFQVRGMSALPAEKRAQLITERIVKLADDPAFARQALRLEPQSDATIIMAGTTTIMILTDADAKLEGIDRHTLSRGVIWRIGEAVDAWRRDRSPANLQRSILVAIGATVLMILATWAGLRLFRSLRRLIEERIQQRIHDLQVREFHVIRAQNLCWLLNRVHSLFWTVALLAALYVYFSSVLALFPWTRGLANNLTSFLLDPLRTLGMGFLKAVPKLIFLLVIYLITRYLLKLVRLFFASIADGSVVLPEFEADWAWPTYRLVRLMLLGLALIVAYPYIPGSETEAFKGLSIFVGIIFSLGSSSLIGNLIAGYSMTYRRAFRVGDRVKIGEHLGDVEQMRLLVTHLRTPKNEEVIIPNSTILGGDVVNFSTLARQHGLILHTTVGIGYETPWRQVEAMLLEAAARTPGLLREPEPFVRQKSLGDFCVTYEINVYCSNPQEMFRLYTELHRNILDLFNEYGVQIMTPAYEGDPEQPKVVPKEQWFTAPARPPEG